MESQKKADQKRRRFVARLHHYKGITCSETCEKNIILCNSGQATGMYKDKLMKLIHNAILGVPVPKYIAEKGESHSFLAFDSVEYATVFYEKCNGLLILLDDKNKEVPVYLSYVKSVPNDEILCTNKDPEGLYIFDNFITEEEERKLVGIFNIPNTDNGDLKNRQVKHYGFEFRYGSNDVDLTSPLDEKIPNGCDFLWPRLKSLGINLDSAPDQLTVNKYSPGQGIPSHVDRHSPFGDVILSLSLGSSVLMDWKHSTGKYVPVHVQRRSMLVMTDAARYDWQHGIQPRTWDPILEERMTPSGIVKVLRSDIISRGERLSLTFRWTRAGPCHCPYKALCDNVKVNSTDDIDNSLASTLEELHVHQVYEKIAGHFSTTRHKPWPKVVEFMANVPTGSVVVDLGCGNGKNIMKRNDIIQIAAERSSGLLDECKSHVASIAGADRVRLDLLHNNLKDGCADFIICIAVIHHFSSEARRVQAISVISRLLRSGGKALITVWARDQTKSNYLNKSKEVEERTRDETHVTVAGLNLPVHENRTQFQHNDLLVPWKLRQNKTLPDNPESTLLRYYHVFRENELHHLCSKDPNLIVDNSFYEEGNWCVVCRRT